MLLELPRFEDVQRSTQELIDSKLNNLPYCLFLKRSFYSVLPFSDNRPEVGHLPMGGPGIGMNGPTTVRLAPGVPENLLRLYLVACGVGDSRKLSNTDDDLISSVYFDVAVCSVLVTWAMVHDAQSSHFLDAGELSGCSSRVMEGTERGFVQKEEKQPPLIVLVFL